MADLPLGPHGGDGRRTAIALGLDPAAVVDLSASVNPFAPDVNGVLRQLLDEQPWAATDYPDPTEAERALAGAIGVDPARLVLTNGGAEAIAIVASIERAGQVDQPEFSLYERHLETVARGAPRWRSNPSNPLGTLAAPEERARVWDEAYYAMATGQWTRGDDASWRLGSLTKLWNCLGLRIGYAIAPTVDLAVQVRDRQPRWAVNGLALGAVPLLLAMTDVQRWAAQIAAQRARLIAELAAIGYRADDTVASWVLVHDQRALRHELAAHGLFVRDCESYGMPGVFRVAVPSPSQWDAAMAAFGAVAGHG